MDRGLIAAGALFGALLFAIPNTALADAQISARLVTGLGSSLGSLDRELLIDTGLRSEVMFGAPGDEHFRVGPALDIRTADFHTLEGSLGAAVLLPIVRGFPIVLSASAGYAFRRDPQASGAIFVGTLAWGYRSYDFHGTYGLAFQVYCSARVHLNEPSRYEVTAGIELDLEILVGVPYAFFRSLARRGRPEEPNE